VSGLREMDYQVKPTCCELVYDIALCVMLIFEHGQFCSFF